MRSRRRGVVAVAAFVVVATWMVVWLSPWRGRINRAGFDRIDAGMSRQEVEAILGSAPGDYTVVKNATDWHWRHNVFVSFWPPRDAANLPWEKRHWISDEGAIAVTFDCNGRVLYKSFENLDEYPKRTPLEVTERLRSILVPAGFGF